MAILLADSFDFYNTTTDITLSGAPWTAISAGQALSSTTPYSVGRSLNHAANASLTANTFSNEATIYIALALAPQQGFTGVATAGLYITLVETAGNQVTLHWASDGNFYVRAGAIGGTIIGTWAMGMASNTWAHFQIKVVINNTTGSVEVRKNGNTVNDYTLTGVNTRNGTANAYANKFGFATTNTAGNLWWIDDVFVNSASGAAPTSWPGQIRAVQLMPTADTAQKDLTPSVNTSVVGGLGTAGTYSLAANIMVTPPTSYAVLGGTATKITVKLNAGFTGKATCAVYTDSAGAPGTLVAQTIEITNPATGDNDFTFTSPPVLPDGVSYWLAFWANAASVLNHLGGLSQPRQVALNYTSAAGVFPSTFGTVTQSGTGTLSIAMTMTPLSNYGFVNELINNADTDYVFGGTAGNTDLYDIADLATTPNSITAVVTKNLMKKNDTGARTATTRVKSGATSQDASTITLGATYVWQTQNLVTDPNTSAAWTAAAVNALQIGPKVVA